MFGIVIFVHVISEQINYKVEASLLSQRSCDEGGKFLAWNKNRKQFALFVSVIKT